MKMKIKLQLQVKLIICVIRTNKMHYFNFILFQ